MFARGYLSNGRRLWGWIITTKRGQCFIGIRTRPDDHVSR